MKIPRWTLLLGPVLCFGFGFLLNVLAMVANGNQMPVYVPGCTADLLNEAAPAIHTCMNLHTRLILLCDIIFIRGDGGVYASIGDMFEWVAQLTWYPALLAWLTLLLNDVELFGK
jgi:hypothetical protein